MTDYDIMAELDAAVGGEPLDETPAEGTPLTSDQATQWLAQLGSIERQRGDINSALVAAISRLQGAASKRLAELDEQELILRESLEIYHQMKIAEDPTLLTIVLPTGTLPSKMGQPKWVYEDEGAFEEWALESLPDAITLPKPKLNKNDAKKLLKDKRVSDGRILLGDGTVVPGVKVIDPVRGFDAKPNPY